MRRPTAVTAATLLLAAVAAALAGGTASAAPRAVAPAVAAPSAAEQAWLAQVSAVCHRWELKLEQVPPPISVGSTLALGTLAAKALPLLEGQQRETSAVAPPASLQRKVAALLDDSGGAIQALRALRAAATKGDLPGAQRALAVFLAAQSLSRARSLALGIRC